MKPTNLATYGLHVNFCSCICHFISLLPIGRGRISGRGGDQAVVIQDLGFRTFRLQDPYPISGIIQLFGHGNVQETARERQEAGHTMPSSYHWPAARDKRMAWYHGSPDRTGKNGIPSRLRFKSPLLFRVLPPRTCVVVGGQKWVAPADLRVCFK